MTRLTRIILIAIVVFAGALAPQATEAATLRIEVREPGGGGGAGTTPRSRFSVDIRNLETGAADQTNTDRNGVARLGKLPAGKYMIRVSYYERGTKTHFYWRTYRSIGRGEAVTITVQPGKFAAVKSASTMSGSALADLKKGDRAKAASGLSGLRDGVKQHGRAQIELGRLFGGVRTKLMGKLPKHLRDRLEATLARTKPDKRADVIENFRRQTEAQLLTMRNLFRAAKPGKNRDSFADSHRKSVKQTEAIIRTLDNLWYLYEREIDHRKNVEEGTSEIKKVNRALNAKKPASQASSSDFRPGGSSLDPNYGGGPDGGGGQGGDAGFCWVARAVYGADNPRWRLFRAWMLEDAPAWSRALYARYGARVAPWVDRNPLVKGLLKLWMDATIAGDLGREPAP